MPNAVLRLIQKDELALATWAKRVKLDKTYPPDFRYIIKKVKTITAWSNLDYEIIYRLLLQSSFVTALFSLLFQHPKIKEYWIKLNQVLMYHFITQLKYLHTLLTTNLALLTLKPDHPLTDYMTIKYYYDTTKLKVDKLKLALISPDE